MAGFKIKFPDNKAYETRILKTLLTELPNSIQKPVNSQNVVTVGGNFFMLVCFNDVLSTPHVTQVYCTTVEPL